MSARNRAGRQDSSVENGLKVTASNYIMLKGAMNWRIWRHQVVMALRNHADCLEALPAENIRNNRDHPDMKRDGEAYDRITNSLDHESTYHLVVGTRFAKEAWDALHDVFGDQGVHEVIGLLQGLFELKQDQCANLREYVLQFQSITSQLAAMGESINDQVLAVLMLQGLSASNKDLRRLIQSKTTKVADGQPERLELRTVVSELLKEARVEESEKGADSGKALKIGAPGSNGRGNGGKKRKGGGGNSGNSNKAANATTSATGASGNFRKRPWSQGSQPTAQPAQQQTTSAGSAGGSRYCAICKEFVDHVTSRCLRGPHPPCKKCGRTNHAEVDHKDFPSNKRFRFTNPDQPGSGSGGPNQWVMAGMAHTGGAVEINKSVDLYIDSGASKTMVGDLNLLHNYIETGNEQIECAAGKNLSIKGKGDLKLVTRNEMDLQEIGNVCYVPGLVSNLLSVYSISKSGYVTVFRNNTCEVFDAKDVKFQGSPLLKTEEKNGTYKLELQTQTANVALKTVVHPEGKTLWHRRLAHLGRDNLDLILSKDLVDGITEKQSSPSTACDVCAKSKQTQAPHPRSGARRANNLLDLVHSDVCQITDGPSRNGYRYFITFIDDKSRFTTVAMMRHKSEAFGKFTMYKNMMERSLGKPLKVLRSDNGGEYKSGEFINFFKNEGMIRQYSRPNEPEMNGVSERANRSLCERMRALLKEAGLHFRFWPEALEMAVYIKNVTPTKAVDGMVPYQAWTGFKPNIANLRIFGCLAKGHIHEGVKKTRDRSKDCIFIGFDPQTPGFKLLDLQTNEIFISGSVEFDETIFPAKERNHCIDTPVQERSSGITLHIEGSGSGISTTRDDQEPSRGPQNGTNPVADSVSESRGNGTSTSGERNNGTNPNPDAQNIPIREEQPQPLGKRQRVPKKFPDFIAYGIGEVKEHRDILTVPATLLVPNSYKEATKPECEKRVHWQQAMLEEIKSFERNKVWDLVPLPAGASLVGNKWVYKLKADKNGTDLYRARLVAKGYTQIYGVDYHETFAPVVRRTTLRILFATAINFDYKIDHLDVKTAFLYGDLSEDIYMSQPEGFSAVNKEHMVCKLNKAMYGLKQAARSWYLKADHVLKRLNFKNFPDEPCVYIKGAKDSLIMVALYVDDFFVIYNDIKDKEELVRVLMPEFKVKDLGEARNCLGVELVRDWDKGTLVLRQSKYIKEILKRFRFEGCHGVKTPMNGRPSLASDILKPSGSKTVSGTNKRKNDGCYVEEEEPPSKFQRIKNDRYRKIEYRELIGCLLYLSVNTRPDIAYTVSFLSQFNSNYTEEHWDLAKRVLRYLQHSMNFGLHYKKHHSPSFCLTGYADADWAGDKSDFKSYSGYCFTLDDNLISWESKKQKLTAQSSAEAEYISITEAAKESVYLNELIGKIFNVGEQTVTMFNDNKSAIDTAFCPNFNVRTKYMGVRKQFVRDCVENGDIELMHLNTASMPADIMTKPLTDYDHEKFCKMLNLFPD